MSITELSNLKTGTYGYVLYYNYDLYQDYETIDIEVDEFGKFKITGGSHLPNIDLNNHEECLSFFEKIKWIEPFPPED
jgi:hypothetical protein